MDQPVLLCVYGTNESMAIFPIIFSSRWSLTSKRFKTSTSPLLFFYKSSERHERDLFRRRTDFRIALGTLNHSMRAKLQMHSERGNQVVVAAEVTIIVIVIRSRTSCRSWGGTNTLVAWQNAART